MAKIEPTQDAIIDPDATQAIADIYAQNGPVPPTLQPPQFLTNALGTLTSFGNADRTDMAAPYVPPFQQTPDAIDRNTPPTDQGISLPGIVNAITGATVNNPAFQPLDYNGRNAHSIIPGLEGATNFLARQVQQGPFATGVLGINPDVNNAIANAGSDAEKQQIWSDYWNAQSANAALGMAGPLERVGGFPAGSLGARLAAQAEGKAGVAGQAEHATGAGNSAATGYSRYTTEAAARAQQTGKAAYLELNGDRATITEVPPRRATSGFVAFPDGSVEVASFSDNGSVTYHGAAPEAHAPSVPSSMTPEAKTITQAEAEGPRYVVKAPRTASGLTQVIDTTTGKAEPRMFTKAEDAQATADKLNAMATASAKVAPEVDYGAALTQIPTDVGTAVRRAARATPALTGDVLAATPETRAYLDRALAAAKIPATDESASALGDRLLAQERARPSVGNRNYQKMLQTLGAKAEAEPGTATNEALATAQGKTFAPGTGAALKPGSSAAEVSAARPTRVVPIPVKNGMEYATTDASGNIVGPRFSSEAEARASLPAEASQNAARGTKEPSINSSDEGEVTAALRARGTLSGPIDPAEAAYYARTGTQPRTIAPDSFDTMVGDAGVPPKNTERGPQLLAGGSGSRRGGGGPIGSGPAPEIPNAPTPRSTAKALGAALIDIGFDIPKSMILVTHLPLLRQGLPLAADAVLRGEPQEAALALGRTLQSYVASDAKMAALQDSFTKTLTDAGAPDWVARKLVTDPHGPLSAREDYTLTSALANVPVLKQLNRGFPTMMNSLRVGMAVNWANMAKEAGQGVNWPLIADRVSHISGRGDLPFAKGSVAQKLYSKALFGPRLLTAPWQQAGDTIISLRNIGSDVLNRRALNTTDLAQVRAVANYVIAGMAIMEMAQKSGITTETNTDSRDWGRMVMPDGTRIDLWGAYGPDARLIAQTLTWLNETHLGIGTPLRPMKYGAQDLTDTVQRYLRSKLGPGIPEFLANVVTGKTGAGDPFVLRNVPQQIQADPLHHLPIPIAGEQLTEGNPQTTGLRFGLAELGAGVINTPRRIQYDGLGAPHGDPNYNTGSVLSEYARLASGSDWRSGDPVMAAPPTTIGEGANKIQLDPTSADTYVRMVGQVRSDVLGQLVNSADYQAASDVRKRQMFDQKLAQADKTATQRFLASAVVTATDPAQITAEALNGFIKQDTLKDKAYWVALLDRAGKLTPQVAQAINGYEIQSAKADKRTPFSVAEYQRYAPLVHEYLSHAPYGTDANPFGTPTDWLAVDQARQTELNRRDELMRQGVNPVVAEQMARSETLRRLTGRQQAILINGAALTNPARRLMTQRYGPILSRFLGSNANTYRESNSAYTNFPNQ